MAECPQFQLLPQIVPIYRPPPPPNATFPVTRQPIYGSMPAHFGYPPVTWSPVHHFPPLPSNTQQQQSQQPVYNQEAEDVNSDAQQPQSRYPNNNNNGPADDLLGETQQAFQCDPPPRLINLYSRNTTSKFDTRHEEFRKYLEEMGILSTFTNILSEMYQDPLRPNDPLGYLRDKLNCSQPDSIELSNLRLWCEQYQTKTARLEIELKHVIERLRKYEPYINDDSLFTENSSENDCISCELEVAKQGHVFGNKEENANYELFKNNY